MSNNTFVIDLINNYAINIGSDYEISIQLCNAPDLTDGYTGLSQIRQNVTGDVVISPTVTVVSKDIFTWKIPNTGYPANLQAGNYIYDVLFSKTDNRFYPIGGRCQLVARSTRIM